ncbi:MAG: SUMF1/EgtB/PvdO family nonheme iron enzyme [Bacteroidales bacterium]|nr:SUMF1/EgtB/PvdO family nonheme iron enzyme [Bacteroidales bacterium]
MKKLILPLFFALLTHNCVAQQDSVVVEVKGVRIVMIKVEGGTYQRGCNPKSESDTSCRKANRPQHTVSVNTFYIAKYEVTQRLYYEVTGKQPSWFKPTHFSDAAFDISFDGPVERVSWYDAVAFTDTLSKLTGRKFRLPTEAEWEYAARGGIYKENYRYAGGNELDNVAWYHHGRNARPEYYIWPREVGLKQPNALGLYDMTGNVGEWCSDWFDSKYYQTQAHFKNPKGPKDGEKKVYRDASSVYGLPWMMEVTARKGERPENGVNHIGFRLAMDAQ